MFDFYYKKIFMTYGFDNCYKYFNIVQVYIYKLSILSYTSRYIKIKPFMV